ncbi:MAG: hypothetical protein HY320_06780 [Armatimonadetes bacterium]|nr:hypothetical protein [Armatimonadota bacterium]
MERQIEVLSEVQQMLSPHGVLIITSDAEMEQLERDPNMKVRAFDSRFVDLAKSLAGQDGALIDVAYDFFFGGDRREYFPTSPQVIRTFKALHDAARACGIGFGASVLSPLDLGPAYYREKGRGGQSHQFREGVLNPDGSYAVPLHVQRQWFHNKGPVPLRVHSVRAFAFSEQRIGDSACYAVAPASIIDISNTAQLAVDEKTARTTSLGYGDVEGIVSGRASGVGARNRVLVVVVYDVEEMDYFHPDALPFLCGVLDAHQAAGISYDSFYSDEMHIQFDWDLQTHFGPTEVNTRYITPGLVEEYARRYGEQYRDFEKYLVYFAFAQHGPHPSPKNGGGAGSAGEPEMAQHVFGSQPADIYATWKFRRDYFRLLTDHVVDLFTQGKRYGKQLLGRQRVWTRAHATWGESPTYDHVSAAWKPADAPTSRYDYTPAYEWSASIRENISACYDYFRWGDFLTGMGSDHPEAGFIDRNYYGAALAASFGAFNDVPYSYWGHWGMPAPVSQRLHDVAAAFGLAERREYCSYVQDWQHRKTPVLALYPLDLNHVEERYGSWMVQYGYCDYLTDEKFAEWAQVLPNGHFRVKDREYTTLVVLYEPMALRATLQKLEQIGERGGKVLWSGPPPAIYHEDGADAAAGWQRMFGIASAQGAWEGRNAEGATVSFQGALEGVPAFRVPTHLLPDLVYPVEPGRDAEVAAAIALGNQTLTLATARATARGGQFVYFGGRPRDDQSGSTPDAPRTLFHLLCAVGAYAADGPGWAEVVSNTGDFLACESPNGAVSITHHYCKVQENWRGEFFRPEGEQFDESVLPPSRLTLKEMHCGPYRVSYEGERVVTFRMAGHVLAAFSGADTQGITINGREYRFTTTPANLTFASVPAARLGNGVRQAWFVVVSHSGGGQGEIVVRLPFEIPDGAQWAADPRGNGRGVPAPAAITRAAGVTDLYIPPDCQGAPLYVFTQA